MEALKLQLQNGGVIEVIGREIEGPLKCLDTDERISLDSERDREMER